MTPSDLERLIRRDPAGRGLLSAADAPSYCPDHLTGAATSLVREGSRVGIVTGFFVPDATPPAAETDGVVGSILLADVLQSSGIDAFLITDEQCLTTMQAAISATGRRPGIVACPLHPTASANWRMQFEANAGAISHLIAIERPAPNYTPQILRECELVDDPLLEQFVSRVPSAVWGRCHNMRGVDIENTSAELYRLFEERRPGVRTIGIGDGGNEIGMGSIPWPQLVSAINSPHAARIASRTKTDWTILAGVSDWGAFALAAAVCLVQDDLSPLIEWTADRIESVLNAAVIGGPAIDGITRLQEATVDGLPFMTFAQPWLFVRQQLGLDDESRLSPD